MKTITFAIVALMLSACAGSRYSSDSGRSSSRETSAQRAYSGSSTAVPTGHTMNDHDKMLEMCRSMKTTKSCADIMKECEGESNQTSCMHQYMK